MISRCYLAVSYSEGCSGICGYLTSDLISGHIARNIGLNDLVLCDRVKPLDRHLAKCLHGKNLSVPHLTNRIDSTTKCYSPHPTLTAVVGALALSTNVQRAQGFVLDIMIAQLAERGIIVLLAAKGR